MSPARRVPLPPSLARPLAAAGTNRSLVFDKRVDTYDANWELGAEAKRTFLSAFAESPAASLADFHARRDRTVGEALGARAVDLVTQTRLVVGLGLPQPTETGFLLDRLTGAPYLPGSSVKGVLRAAARRLAAGELRLPDDPGDDAAFFRAHLDRLFGPALDGDGPAAKGELAVYDAFPRGTPRLEVDVLTPHQSDYYSGADVPPADWNDPVPVPFLTVAPGTGFRFYLRLRPGKGAAGDLDRVERLLRAALDELGIGGKTAAGYGRLAALGGGSKKPSGKPASPARAEPDPPPWQPAHLHRVAGTGELVAVLADGSRAYARGPEAQGILDALPEALLARLHHKKRREIPVEAGIEREGLAWRLVRVRPPGNDGAG